jgi:soluble lytic murein transglycosylase
MNRNRRMFILLAILLGVFVLINTPFVWKWMYPIKYKEEVMQASARYQVDPHLILAIIRTESDFETDKISKKGAIGLMQVMPDTADWVISRGPFKTVTKEQLLIPKVNIEIGTWYLAFLLDTFQGDYVKAIAAYNAGPGNVSGWIDRKLWNGSMETIQDIPIGETRHYVQRVLYFQERYRKIYNSQLK